VFLTTTTTGWVESLPVLRLLLSLLSLLRLGETRTMIQVKKKKKKKKKKVILVVVVVVVVVVIRVVRRRINNRRRISWYNSPSL
jgi:ABC-type phosphate/phosphonate transport system permease subunit